MCTVTFLPLENNNFILTSSRDEQSLRKTFTPKKYKENGIEMLFPKDKIAGGTWVGTSSKNRLICLLNGAFKNHIKKKKYKRSRGVIAKEILQTSIVKKYIKNLNLEGIEPFTMVIIDWNDEKLNLYELIWDETKKHVTKLENKPKIWSSSTLYENEMKETRKYWFKDWIANNKFSSSTILKFHHSEIGDKEQSILMKRSYVETVSITSVKKENKIIEMLYEDVVHNKITKTSFNQ
ncbi:MAG: NRDE family protein [Lutibacter sp.]|uniref:NRDE family protein n=1 Tax=Lutibacter sp. TaxID=1925666 RepID=UPI00385B3FF0